MYYLVKPDLNQFSFFAQGCEFVGYPTSQINANYIKHRKLNYTLATINISTHIQIEECLVGRYIQTFKTDVARVLIEFGFLTVVYLTTSHPYLAPFIVVNNIF